VTHLALEPMDDAAAQAIATWRYPPPYDFYDADADPEDLAELLDPAARADAYLAARDADGGLVGFFCIKPDGDAVEIGLGLRPDLIGRGLGAAFLAAGLAHARQRHAPRRFRLFVAAFNHRAIRVYERAGFRATAQLSRMTNGGCYAFVEMTREEATEANS
jgi:ribosomal-protein-alanine N-acetyltransferase